MKKKQIIYFILDILIVVFSFLFSAYLKPATVRIYIPQYVNKAIILVIIWIMFSLLANKYTIPKQKKISTIVGILFRSNFLILGLISFILFVFKFVEYSRLITFGTLFIAFFLEFFLSLIFYFHTKLQKESDFSEKLSTTPINLDIQTKIESEKITFGDLYPIEDEKNTAYYSLKNKYLADLQDQFNWLNNTLPLKSIHNKEILSFNTKTLYNIKNYEPASQSLFINFHNINDFKHINKFLIQTNKNLKQKGIFVGCGITNKEHYKQFMAKFPPILSSIFYLIDFTFRRVMPKLPGFKEIYFALTKGRNRALSKAEILGRLYFCGFEVYDITEMDKVLYFIAVKKNSPRKDPNPSYGPLFKMRRIGKNHNFIYVYKFRTMHPYSEYLQSYIVAHNGYDEKGKIKDDFRVTRWGKFLRRYWLDELPQLINFFRGELSLIGVRPISERFLREYPKDLIEKRIKYKPGCIPPYVALNMQSKEKSMDAEIIYLNEKEKHPFWTDIKYFFKAIYNIAFGKIRSK